MAYKVTISDGTILEKSIETVTFNANPPPDNYYCMRTYTINSIQITGTIGAGEKTVSLYEWSLLPVNNPDCYKEIVVEQTHADQTVRIVKFSKAFIVDYSESYAKGEGFGHFSIFIRQLAGVDIELTKESTLQPAMTEPSNEVVELIPPLVQSTGIIATSSIVKKDRPNFTDILAKKRMIQDNVNAGVAGVENVVPNKIRINPNPFKGKTPTEIDQMFKNKGFETRGADPINGYGGYVNPKGGRSYHLDTHNSFNEAPHVDVNRSKTYKGSLEKKKLFIDEEV